MCIRVCVYGDACRRCLLNENQKMNLYEFLLPRDIFSCLFVLLSDFEGGVVEAVRAVGWILSYFIEGRLGRVRPN